MVEFSPQSVRQIGLFLAVILLTMPGFAAGGAAPAEGCTYSLAPSAGKPGIAATVTVTSGACLDHGTIITGGHGEGSIGRRPSETPALLPVSDSGHPAIELEGGNLPEVTLAATADGDSGWNLRSTLQNFALAPQNASTPHVAGQGHMHLYVDRVKVARVYGEWFHLPALPQGEYELMVTLSANDHSPLLVDGEPIAAAVTITQPAPASHKDHTAMHMAATEDLPAASAPGVTLDIRPDPMAGFNVHIRPTGFTLAPEKSSGEHVPGEGHVHLYVDDVKVARVYSEWFHLPALASGDHVVRAELFTNDHRAYATGGVAIGDSASVAGDLETAGTGSAHSH